jgi:hypothetical protein
VVCLVRCILPDGSDSQKGTVVDKLKEEVVRGVNHLREVIKICEGRKTSALQAKSPAEILLRVHVWIEP